MFEVEDVALGELGADIPAAFATGPFGSAVSAKNFVDDGMPMLRGSNLSNDVGVRLDDSDVVFVPESLALQFERSIVKSNDLIFTCWGTIGQIGIIQDNHRFRKYLVSNKQMKMTPDGSRVVPLYLYYFLSQPDMIEFVRGRAIGSSVPGFNLGQLKSLPVKLPSKACQQAIVEVLGAVDDKIAVNDRVVEGVRLLLAEAFATLGVDDGAIDASRLNVRVDDLLSLNPRTTTNSDHPVYLEMKNLPDRAITVNAWSHRSAKGGARFRNGDTLLARITPCLENGKTGFVDFLSDDEVGVGSTEFIVMRPRDGIPAAFPYFLAKSLRFREYAIRRMVGTSGRQRLSAADVAEYLVQKPGDLELCAFDELSVPLLKRVRAAVDETRTLTRTRDELLPLLMSGKVRVKDAEAAVNCAL